MDSLPFIALALVTIATMWWGVPALYVDLLRRHLRTSSRTQHTIHLTFDDGPGRVLTPQILDRLDRLGAEATFFVLGRNAAQLGGVVREAAARGHTIGCHGHDHINYWFCSPWRAIGDVKRGWAAAGEALGVDARRLPFRPPFGKLSLPVLLYLRFHRTPIWMWTVDSEDTSRERYPDPTALCRAVRASGGGVVLMHDHDRAQPDRNNQLLELLDGVGELRTEGWAWSHVVASARDARRTARAMAQCRPTEAGDHTAETTPPLAAAPQSRIVTDAALRLPERMT